VMDQPPEWVKCLLVEAPNLYDRSLESGDVQYILDVYIQYMYGDVQYIYGAIEKALCNGPATSLVASSHEWGPVGPPVPLVAITRPRIPPAVCESPPPPQTGRSSSCEGP